MTQTNTSLFKFFSLYTNNFLLLYFHCMWYIIRIEYDRCILYFVAESLFVWSLFCCCILAVVAQTFELTEQSSSFFLLFLFLLTCAHSNNATRKPISSSCDISCSDKSTSSNMCSKSHTTDSNTNATHSLRNSPRIREKRQFKITGTLRITYYITVDVCENILGINKEGEMKWNIK